MTEASGTLRFSLVVPMYNEEDNVDPLIDELISLRLELGKFELIIVDDGSKDATHARLLARMADMPELRVISLVKNFGQSSALCAGIDHARAKITLFMDGDRQNDPHDFPKMLAALADADGVSGIRTDRKDNWVRRMSSKIANGVRNKISGDHVVDSASGIKAFKTEVLRKLPRFRGMHRFIPTLARLTGAKVIEIPVQHRARVAGKAKYGVGNRAFRAFIDLLAVRWLKKRWIDYEVRPEHDAPLKDAPLKDAPLKKGEEVS